MIEHCFDALAEPVSVTVFHRRYLRRASSEGEPPHYHIFLQIINEQKPLIISFNNKRHGNRWLQPVLQTVFPRKIVWWTVDIPLKWMSRRFMAFPIALLLNSLLSQATANFVGITLATWDTATESAFSPDFFEAIQTEEPSVFRPRCHKVL